MFHQFQHWCLSVNLPVKAIKGSQTSKPFVVNNDLMQSDKITVALYSLNTAPHHILVKCGKRWCIKQTVCPKGTCAIKSHGISRWGLVWTSSKLYLTGFSFPFLLTFPKIICWSQTPWHGEAVTRLLRSGLCSVRLKNGQDGTQDQRPAPLHSLTLKISNSVKAAFVKVNLRFFPPSTILTG